MADLTIGATFLMDGKAWTIEATDGVNASALREEGGRTSRVRFDAREVMDMGSGLFGLPGRIEAPVANPNEIGVAALRLDQ